MKNQEYSRMSYSSLEFREEAQAGEGNVRVLREVRVLTARGPMISPREGMDREEKSCPEGWLGISKGGPVGVPGGGRRPREPGALRPTEEGGGKGPEVMLLGQWM